VLSLLPWRTTAPLFYSITHTKGTLKMFDLKREVGLDAFKAVTATTAAPQMSRHYSFIPTTTALATLRQHGWVPTAVRQANARVEHKKGYQTHMVRLENTAIERDWRVGTTIPQLALRNAHCGSSAFTLDLALMELRCTNGLMVSTGGKEQMRVLHRAFDPATFGAALDEVLANLPDVMATVERWRRLHITEATARQFAREAITLRWQPNEQHYGLDTADSNQQVLPAAMLEAKRYEERELTLWNVYNVVQEKLLQGGVDVMKLNAQGHWRQRSARPIKNIGKDVRLNKQLWQLATAVETNN